MGAGASTAGEAYAVPGHALESSYDSLSTFNTVDIDDRSISTLAESFQLRKAASKSHLSWQAQGSKRHLLKPIIADEEDWIAVEDGDDPLEDSVALPARGALQRRGDEGSFRVTESGTIHLQGRPALTSRGIVGGAPEAPVGDRLLSIVDRAVLLEPLGKGASATVHKALDLVDLRLVAIKARATPHGTPSPMPHLVY